jgi:putative peptide zinc metalloprotease protein
MGVGLYFIYPGFFTDATDSYRLGRWARVRTDLGGFYFSLIFAAGLIALSIVSGQEFLLVVVLLINLDIIRQTIPFFRFDGYWALADLTGIPDLYSMMGPFLKSLLPIPGRVGRQLPRMKPWVTIVFVVYMLITLPLIAHFMTGLLRGAPHLLAILWDALQAQTVAFSSAQRQGDRLGSLAAVAQAAILALEIAGLVFFLSKLLWGSARGGWRLMRRVPTAALRDNRASSLVSGATE